MSFNFIFEIAAYECVDKLLGHKVFLFVLGDFSRRDI